MKSQVMDSLMNEQTTEKIHFLTVYSFTFKSHTLFDYKYPEDFACTDSLLCKNTN